MYGVTQMESVDLLDAVALNQGMLERERDEELLKYFHVRCKKIPELCVARTIKEYKKYVNDDSEKVSTFAAQERNIVLDVLSDARTVAPVVQTGRYHSTPNIQSYFYVFTHKTLSKDYIVSTESNNFYRQNFVS